jgi:peptidyl-prolyl cis-trans isomerase A (cyclophilin A)
VNATIGILVLYAGVLLTPATPAPPPAPADAAAAVEIPEGLELSEGWYTRIDTSMGVIVARLLPEQAPQATAYFAALAEGRLEWNDPYTGEPSTARYYDGVAVHKVMAGQRFEAGDHTGTGMGAAPFWIPHEGIGPATFHAPWRLGMTGASLDRVSGSMFFITAASQPWLTGRHPCFGTVVHGKEEVRQITAVKAYSNGKPIDPVVLEKVRIFKVGDPEPLPEPEPYTPRPTRMQMQKKPGIGKKR